jgi:hypothetical protein
MLPDSEFWLVTAKPGGLDAPFEMRAKWRSDGSVMLVSDAMWEGRRRAFVNPWSHPQGALHRVKP